MKTKRIVALLSLLLISSVCAAPWTRAADAAAVASEHPNLERFAAELNLTEEQKAAIAPILRQQVEEFRALQADTSLRRMQKLRRAKEINQQASGEIRAHLDPEQQVKYDALRAEMREQMKARIQERRAQSSTGG